MHNCNQEKYFFKLKYMFKVLPRKQTRRRLKGKYSDKLYYIIISVDSRTKTL